MNERRNWGEARTWSSEAHAKAVAESQQLEALMRSILKLFADGCLVYRSRDKQMPGVSTKSDRLKRIRSGLVTLPLEPGIDGPAAVA
jgi:hypothetical protein